MAGRGLGSRAAEGCWSSQVVGRVRSGSVITGRRPGSVISGIVGRVARRRGVLLRSSPVTDDDALRETGRLNRSEETVVRWIGTQSGGRQAGNHWETVMAQQGVGQRWVCRRGTRDEGRTGADGHGEAAGGSAAV